MKYIILVEEWNYPCESGREPVGVTFDSDEMADALKYAEDMCENEMDNFEKNINGDCLVPEHFKDNEAEGYILTSKMGLDRFYYAVRIIELNSIDN